MTCAASVDLSALDSLNDEIARLHGVGSVGGPVLDSEAATADAGGRALGLEPEVVATLSRAETKRRALLKRQAEEAPAQAAQAAPKRAKKAPKAYDADKAFAKIAAKAAKKQKNVDGIVEVIFSYAVLKKLSQGDHISLCQRVKEVDEHCSSSLIDGVTMKEMKTILKEQKALHRKLAKAAKKD